MQAEDIVKELRCYYSAQLLQFDMHCSMFINGSDKKKLRQEMMRLITGTTPPLSKCSPAAVATALKAYYEQLTLF